ncbi:MAG: tRNA pseudouridine(38-40) synthase TruA [Rhodothermia bacterium]
MAEDRLITYKLLIEYDGTNLHGWQTQAGTQTVQDLIESALEVVLKSRPNVVGSGRTDAGVHARGQVAHFCLTTAVDVWKLKASLNGLLAPCVRILDLSEASRGFHARYHAILRTYHYYISTAPRALDGHVRQFVRPEPDFDAMNSGAEILIGEHDFDAFCRTKSETKNRLCRVDTAIWIPETRAGDWCFSISANRFLHGMVRTIVGTLMEIGHGKRRVEDLVAILESRDRRMAGQAAPARGLVLEQVTYPDSNE